MMNIHMWDKRKHAGRVFNNAQNIMFINPDKFKIKDNKGKEVWLEKDKFEIMGIFEHETEPKTL